ncbi:unnamed protein product [Echinostoma caproni]|uniref:Uncharacterized protein n=1 Tax=Echinostoma caproni TaxID=27848 RepID=A0A3P8HPA3_9TREM|nr:unnamed protein product [Echinostoma caproni]
MTQLPSNPVYGFLQFKTPDDNGQTKRECDRKSIDDDAASAFNSGGPEIAPGDNMPATLFNSPDTCCDLLQVLQKPHSDQNYSLDTQTALVTILVGSRDAVPEDTIVPRELLTVLQKAGVRIELMRDFVQRWRKSRRSSHPTGHYDDAPG